MLLTRRSSLEFNNAAFLRRTQGPVSGSPNASGGTHFKWAWDFSRITYSTLVQLPTHLYPESDTTCSQLCWLMSACDHVTSSQDDLTRGALPLDGPHTRGCQHEAGTCGNAASFSVPCHSPCRFCDDTWPQSLSVIYEMYSENGVRHKKGKNLEDVRWMSSKESCPYDKVKEEWNLLKKKKNEGAEMQ